LKVADLVGLKSVLTSSTRSRMIGLVFLAPIEHQVASEGGHCSDKLSSGAIRIKLALFIARVIHSVLFVYRAHYLLLIISYIIMDFFLFGDVVVSFCLCYLNIKKDKTTFVFIANLSLKHLI